MNAPTGIWAHIQAIFLRLSAPLSRRAVFLAGLFLLALFGGATAAPSAQTTEPILTLNPAQAQAGAIVLVNGRGFGPGGGDLIFFWDGEKVDSHPLETGDSFSIPFPIPVNANPGDHRIDVCAGAPCTEGGSGVKAGASFRVTGAMPSFGGRLAYIYDTDKSLAEEFSTLLGKTGFDIAPIALEEVPQTDFSAFGLVIVGSDTGSGKNWGTAAQVESLQKAPRILGVGLGGHAFFGKIELMIGAPNGLPITGGDVLFPNDQLTSARVPFDLSALSRNERRIPLFDQPVTGVAIDLSDQPSFLLPHALLDQSQQQAPLGVAVGEGCRTLWGFAGSPKEMTPLGQSLFTNLVIFAIGNHCGISQTALCGQLESQALIPGQAVIDFDDLDSGLEIADYYGNGYGVRFEQSSTIHATTYGGHPNDPSKPRSAPNVATNSAIYPATSENVPFPIFFESDQSHVGMWIGNGEDGQGNSANLTANLTAFDRQGKELCSVRINPVPISHTTFMGLSDGLGRIARVELDYGRTTLSESIDNLAFGPFSPSNNIRVCSQTPTTCAPAANAKVAILRDGVALSPPATTDSQGYVYPRRRVSFGDSLWVAYPISTTTRSTLLYTSGAPRLVRALDFNHFANSEMSMTVGPAHPLLLHNLIVSTQWSMMGDAAYQNRLRSHIQKAANYLYDFTDGQMSLANIHVYQNYDKWDEADIRIYASNNLRPHAEIGGVSESDVTDPFIPSVSYYPGYTFMGRTWNRFNLPGEPTDLGVDVSNDWPLALAHELGHYLLYLFDTYLAVTPDGEIVETKSCTGSAMGWVYEPSNTEFIFDNSHWDSACSATVANQTLKRNEWQTIMLWYSSLLAPTAVNPGPTALLMPFTEVTIHPPSNPAVVLSNQTFDLAYQAGEAASGEARAFLIRGNRVIDQGKPAEGTKSITLIGSQTSDRFCVFDVNDFTEDSSEPRHQFGCEVLELGDNSLQMEKDDGWAPVIEISHATSRTLGISVTQEIGAGLSLRAVLYPEDTDTPTAILLAGSDGFYTGTFHSPVDATAAYVQVYVEETSIETDPRRETIVDFGVGGTGAEGPAHWFGGVPVISSDGKAEFARRTDIDLKRGEFIAVQSMAGTPRPPEGRQIVGQAYRLVALPRSLAEEGHVALRIRPPRTDARSSRETLPEVVVAFWNGANWKPIKSVNLDDLIDGRVAIAPTQGVGVYALLLEKETQPVNNLYLPQIER
ncbi:MAG: hypothetical protein WBO46_19495 [Caldilineaceae bacterium]